jgi:hypothetical protein
MDSNINQQTRPAKTTPKVCLMRCFKRKSFRRRIMMPALVLSRALSEKRVICDCCHLWVHFRIKGNVPLASSKMTISLPEVSVETCACFFRRIFWLVSARLLKFHVAIETCFAPSTADVTQGSVAAGQALSPRCGRRDRVEVILLGLCAVFG